MIKKCRNDRYKEFLKQKLVKDNPSGFEISEDKLNRYLFDWQRVIVRWALYRGRAALFEDCGLGKTIQQLEWANQVVRKTNESVLILAPLAVSEQTQREGERFGIKVNICESQNDLERGINITNYEKLHKFDVGNLVGIVLDESSIIKNFAGKRRNQIIEAFYRTPYKLACTATPSPNDYMELGNHSEFLNIMTRTEMLSMFFVNDSGDTGKWRLKGHVKDNVFWEWLASWAVMLSNPFDLGYDDGRYRLPELKYFEHFVECTSRTSGLFVQPVSGLNERRKVRKETIKQRCEKAAEVINSTKDRWIIWCGLNDEGDYLEKIIEDSVQVAGRHSDEYKSEMMNAFAIGNIRRLITKPKIAGFGMNWQICHKAAFVGLSDSWEEFYQATRRIWRYGQKKPVEVHIFLEEREGSVLENIRRKDKQAKGMMENMCEYMRKFVKRELEKAERIETDYCPVVDMEVPEWL